MAITQPLSESGAAAVTGRPRAVRRATSRLRGVDRVLLGTFLRFAGNPPLRCVLPDGSVIDPPGGDVVGTLRFRDRPTLYALLRMPEIGFGEGYTDGRIEVEGDLLEVVAAAYRTPPSALIERLFFSAGTPRPNSLRGSRDNIHQHYDLGNDFYRLWLDEHMLYTCAYYPTPAATLEQAQVAKMHHVCRKVALRPGERVVEAGCGWGSLALHMARHYGVTVRAFNVSSEQIAFARKRAQQEGLADRVEFVEDDYRNVRGKYDAFVSVGMLEHVGIRHYQTLGQIIDRTLSDRGRGLLHFIGRDRPAPINAWIRKRIFPGGYVPALREVCERVLEPAGLSVCDVENLRWHYARTLNHWRRRFEAAEDQVAAMFDAPFVRAWRLYLAGSEASFTTGSLQLFQVLFIRSDGEPLDWMRVTR